MKRVLIENERLEDPIIALPKNFTMMVGKEFRNAMTFLAVIENSLAMCRLFEKEFEDKPWMIDTLLTQGIFTFNFCSTLLFSFPQTKAMNMNIDLKKLGGPGAVLSEVGQDKI